MSEQSGGTPEPTLPVPDTENPLPTRRRRVGAGGTHTHREGCQCYPCKARRRREEAVSLTAGIPDERLVSVDEEPPLSEQLTEPTKRPPIRRGALRTRVAQWMAYRAQNPNMQDKDIAGLMGISPHTLQHHLAAARKQGLLVFDDPLEKIEYEIIPKVVDNLNKFLDERDKTVTIETAKGTIFKQYQDKKGINDAPRTVLALKIEQPDGPEVKIAVGSIVGRPKELDDESIGE